MGARWHPCLAKRVAVYDSCSFGHEQRYDISRQCCAGRVALSRCPDAPTVVQSLGLFGSTRHLLLLWEFRARCTNRTATRQLGRDGSEAVPNNRELKCGVPSRVFQCAEPSTI